MTRTSDVRASLPGLALLVAAGTAAVAVAAVVPLLHPLIAAVVAGLLLGNLVGVPAWAKPGFDQHTRLLNAGIVLLGATVSVEDLFALGGTLVVLVLGTVVFVLLLAEAIGRLGFGLSGPLPSLLAAGSGVCGVSAVVAVGAVIEARERQLALAAATILLFDAVTLLAFPFVGHALSLTGTEFGVWAGLSMFSTGPSVAAGFAHSPEAAQMATVTKLGRNSLIALVVLGYAVAYRRQGTAPDHTAWQSVRRIAAQFPTFVLGFVLLALLTNVSALPAPAVAAVGPVVDWLFAFAFVGLGSSLLVETFRQTGLTPILAVLSSLVVASTTTLVAVCLLVP